MTEISLTVLLEDLIVSLCQDGVKSTELFTRMVAATNEIGKYSPLGSMCPDDLYEGLSLCLQNGLLTCVDYTLPGSSRKKQVYFPAKTRITVVS